MNRTCLRLIVLVALPMFVSGCSSLLPHSQTATKSRWKSYSEARDAFDRIVPNETGTNALSELGLDPNANPNVRVLTYLDLIQRFLPNQAITKDDLDKAVRSCIEGREKSMALEVELNEIRSQRHGNVLLDIFGFQRNTHETGWQFKGLLLLRDGLVVYKLYSGQPEVDRNEKKVKPLGPLQELDNIVIGTVERVR
ncbi:MAG: hypothetical protein HY298_02075 [Verrucomicrobia bacterium]|nr:hypothetical protein [Verrucomicrobiota bacterium]